MDCEGLPSVDVPEDDVSTSTIVRNPILTMLSRLLLPQHKIVIVTAVYVAIGFVSISTSVFVI